MARLLPLPLLFLVVLAGCRGGGTPTTQPDVAVPWRILIDSIHAHNAINLPIEADPYAYHNVYGYGRAFSYLRYRKVAVDEVSTGRLSPQLLGRYGMLFINLVSGDRPPFMLDEIAAIKSFVQNGGGLFVITDHTNCYYHAHILAPLMEQLDIRLNYEMACDRPPNTLGPGNGWLAITRFRPHPVTAGLRCVGYQSGGTVDDRFAVAHLSEQGWGDLWQVRPYGQGDDGGFYGNWTQDPGERAGGLGVVLAKTFGKGRIVIVGDQNLFGDPFFHYADNWRLWLNAVGWLLRAPQSLEIDRYPSWRTPAILFFEQPSAATFGDCSDKGWFHIFCAVGRSFTAFAGDGAHGEWAAVVLAHDDYRLSRESHAALIGHLKAGRHIVMLSGQPDRMLKMAGVVQQLAHHLGPPKVEKAPDRSTLSWPQTGRIIILHGQEGYANTTIPSPTTCPSVEQDRRLAALYAVLQAVTEDTPDRRP